MLFVKEKNWNQNILWYVYVAEKFTISINHEALKETKFTWKENFIFSKNSPPQRRTGRG